MYFFSFGYNTVLIAKSKTMVFMIYYVNSSIWLSGFWVTNASMNISEGQMNKERNRYLTLLGKQLFKAYFWKASTLETELGLSQGCIIRLISTATTTKENNSFLFGHFLSFVAFNSFSKTELALHLWKKKPPYSQGLWIQFVKFAIYNFILCLIH